MSYDFIGSIPTFTQIEKLRLILSTFQDGTGQLVFEPGKSLPGWRDFERSVALAFGGTAQESKTIFDVLVPILQSPVINYGLSCKMRQTLHTVERTGRVTVEVSNSAGKFWDSLRSEGVDDYNTAPDIAGKILIELVNSWHNEVGIQQGGSVAINKSSYLLLQWHKATSRYQLFQYPVQLPNPEALIWEVNGRRLIGRDQKGVIIEWYGHSGGQLKYYPLASDVIWASSIFHLEPLPENDLGYGLKRRVIDYFPKLWQKTEQA